MTIGCIVCGDPQEVPAGVISTTCSRCAPLAQPRKDGDRDLEAALAEVERLEKWSQINFDRWQRAMVRLDAQEWRADTLEGVLAWCDENLTGYDCHGLESMWPRGLKGTPFRDAIADSADRLEEVDGG